MSGIDLDTARERWYRTCAETAAELDVLVPAPYRNRTFAGIIGDIKALSSRKALSLVSRKHGLGLQYAARYLDEGIDGGYGYQACTLEAFDSVLGERRHEIVRGNVLDVGCAVGVTAGVLGLDGVTGFDLFADLLRAAQAVDSRTGARHHYFAADMTRPWPVRDRFDIVFCGLTAHHLKTQADTVVFFAAANRALVTGGGLVLTLPAGSVARASDLGRIAAALGTFGFAVDKTASGLVYGTITDPSLFWMFQVVATKTRATDGGAFVAPDFAFPLIRTPVTRLEKQARVRLTGQAVRRVRHRSFALVSLSALAERATDRLLTFEGVRALVEPAE